MSVESVPGIGPALAGQLADKGVTKQSQLRAIIATLPPRARAHLRWRVTNRIAAADGERALADVRAHIVFRGASGRMRRYPTRVAGSVRRRAPVSKDLDLLVIVPDSADLSGVLASARLKAGAKVRFAETYAVGDRRRSVVLATPRGNYTLDIFLTRRSELPFALLHHTGGKNFNIRTRAHAKRQGRSLNQYGIFLPTGRRAPGTLRLRTEKEVLAFLGVTYAPPSRRE
jgi:DNA polymerase/3'-5' exonuclease PolX